MSGITVKSINRVPGRRWLYSPPAAPRQGPLPVTYRVSRFLTRRARVLDPGALRYTCVGIALASKRDCRNTDGSSAFRQGVLETPTHRDCSIGVTKIQNYFAQFGNRSVLKAIPLLRQEEEQRASAQFCPILQDQLSRLYAC